ncbi:uncharacterized protein LOC126985109 [Eriocheir sinensis]|uniref:uncharacterized protein LOC126985109 n=1 Tax=Eriocheir sinensis TaxID=95602 RepID=UPI0021C65DE0|nr:uncharacterized protein LOC126985109 [Eriocheir sinensis]
MEGPHALLLLTAAAAVIVMVGAATTSLSTQRDAKFLFASNPIMCQGDKGRQGACLPYFRCGVFEGEVEGTCQVVGQCCVVQRSCGETSTARITYFNNEFLPIEDGHSCSVTITSPTSIASREICQLHLAFDMVELAEPTADGACEDQYLEVKGGSESLKICGKNKNQTMVVDVEGRDGPFKVSVVTKDGVVTDDSKWQVKVVQVPCDSDDLAPQGCDQYLTGVTGEVKSYNYDTTASAYEHSAGKSGSRHLQESYRICVRQEEGYCSLKWTAASDDYAFTISEDLSVVTPNTAMKVDADCEFTDHLNIPEANIEGEDKPTTIFCGSMFPPAVLTTSFQMYVVFNGEELLDTDIDNRGFYLKYEQIEC